jgi:hypothetical protein
VQKQRSLVVDSNIICCVFKNVTPSFWLIGEDLIKLLLDFVDALHDAGIT